MTTTPRAGALAVVMASSLCLAAGCSGGGRPPVTTTSSPEVSAPPTSSTTTTSAAGPGPVSACTTTQLSVSIGTGAAAGSTVTAPFVVADTGAPCTLTGYFGLALLNANGRPLGLSPDQDAVITGSTVPPGTVALHGAATAVFAFQWQSSGAGEGSCPVATTVELTAPDQTDHISIAARTALGQEIELCGSGQTYIGPVTASG